MPQAMFEWCLGKIRKNTISRLITRKSRELQSDAPVSNQLYAMSSYQINTLNFFQNPKTISDNGVRFSHVRPTNRNASTLKCRRYKCDIRTGYVLTCHQLLLQASSKDRELNMSKLLLFLCIGLALVSVAVSIQELKVLSSHRFCHF